MLYIIQNNKTGLVKIGISVDPLKRLKQLQTGTGYKLQLLKAYPTDNDLHWERRIHRMLWRNKKKGEWFELDPLTHYLSLLDELLPCTEKRK